MKNKIFKTALLLAFAGFPIGSANADDLQDLKQQLQELKTKIAKIEDDAKKDKASSKPFTFGSNAFNPQIGVVLNGQYINSTNNNRHNQINGFTLGDASAEPQNKGFSLGETEISFASNVDNFFRAAVNLSVEDHHGSNSIEVENAYVQTIALPYSLNLKMGRFFADIGYLNSIHAHHDDFSNRPLPYQVFLDGQYNDDGAQLSWVAPTPFYLEAVVGAFAGDKFPAGGRSNNNGAGAYSLTLKTGGDISQNSSYIAGISYLGSKMGSDGRDSADDGHNTLNFKGSSDLYIAHLKYDWSPDGNNLQRELILQGEYFWRKENGEYASFDENGVLRNSANLSGNQSGWYGEAVYKFLPKWRAGYRYSELNANKVLLALSATTLNSRDLSASANSYMIDFTNSEFSRIRFQYDNAKLIAGDNNETFTLQYIMVIGAHPAHKF